MRIQISQFNAFVGGSDNKSCLQAEDHSNEESSHQKTTSVQDPKSNKTGSPKDQNNPPNEPSDLIASTSKRRRNPHSSQSPKNSTRKTKGGSTKAPAQKQRSLSKISNQTLSMFVNARLENHINKENKYNGIIRILADPGFLQYCYMLIKGKTGNMSPGIDKITLDGLDYPWFCDLAEKLKKGSFKFTPAKRVMIPKPGKPEKRPLGVGSPREKIVQKGLQIILSSIWEPLFLNCSHGFRPNRSTHSALELIYLKGHQFSWVIQGDISKCFDVIPHDVILNTIKEKVVCDRTLHLIKNALTIGYIEVKKNKKRIKSKIGTPQGSVLSPLLANIVLHKLDTFVEEILIPENHKGRRIKFSKAYNKLATERYNKNATQEQKDLALKHMLSIPRMDTNVPNYRRSMFIRYADDFIFLFEGPLKEAQSIKLKIKNFLLKETGFELNDEKTIVTNLKDGFEFLGASIKTLRQVGYIMKTKTRTGKKITIRANLRTRVNMPTKKIIEKLKTARFLRRNPKNVILAKPMTSLVNMDHASIIQFFNSKIHGLINYYSFAANRIEIQNLIWLLRLSLAKTLARKFKLSSARSAFKKFGPNLKDPQTDVKLFVPKSMKTIHHYNTSINLTKPENIIEQTWYSRITRSNLFQKCVICGTTSDIQMHHLKNVKDVRTKMTNRKVTFKKWIGATNRKQIPLCQYHHHLYHHGKLLSYELNQIAKYTGNMSTTFIKDWNKSDKDN